MAIETEQTVLQARSLITSQDPALDYALEDFYAVLPAAIKQWQEIQQEKKSQGLPYVPVIVTTGSITITAGVADAASALDAANILPSEVKKSEIYVTYGGNPDYAVQWKNSRDRLLLVGIQDEHFINAYQNGTTIYFGDKNGSPITGSFTITGESQTVDPTKIPSTEQPAIAKVLADMMLARHQPDNNLGTAKRMQVM